MQLVQADTNFESSGTEEMKTSGFQIKASGTAFKILSDGLYRNKIRAVVREISCNAYDSHVLAGKADQPFKVHLPTRFEPHFSVRDYGTGLSEEDVMSLYTTYFESTKSRSNDFVGAFGLGSKSPFSYTKSFSVTSWHGGKKMSFTAFVDDSYMPSIIKTGEEESNEPNGVEVQMPTSTNDQLNFLNEAKNVYVWFKVRPEANVHIEYVELGQKLFGLEDGSGVYRRHYGHAESHYAVQGTVAYPIDFSALKGKYNPKYQGNHILYFNIGDLDITASREEISYDDRTIENIVNKLKSLDTEVDVELERKINASASYLDACNTFYKDFSFLFSHSAQGSYKGKELVRAIDLDVPNSGVRFFITYQGRLSQVRSLSTSELFDVYYDDLKRSECRDRVLAENARRIEAAMESGIRNRQILLIRCADDYNQSAALRLMEALGLEDLHLTSELPELPREVKEERIKSTSPRKLQFGDIIVPNESNRVELNSTYQGLMDPTLFLLVDEVLYREDKVIFQTKNGGKATTSVGVLRQIATHEGRSIALIKNHKEKFKEVFGVNLESFVEYMEAEFDKALATVPAVTYTDTYNIPSIFGDIKNHIPTEVIELDKNLLTACEILDKNSMVNVSKKLTDYCYIKFANAIGKDVQYKIKSVSAMDVTNAIKEKYPLLECMRFANIDTVKDDIALYIKAKNA